MEADSFIDNTAGRPVVVYLEECVDEVPLLMSPVRQAMGWRIVHTWVRLQVDEYSKKAVQIHW